MKHSSVCQPDMLGARKLITMYSQKHEPQIAINGDSSIGTLSPHHTNGLGIAGSESKRARHTCCTAYACKPGPPKNGSTLLSRLAHLLQEATANASRGQPFLIRAAPQVRHDSP